MFDVRNGLPFRLSATAAAYRAASGTGRTVSKPRLGTVARGSSRSGDGPVRSCHEPTSVAPFQLA